MWLLGTSMALAGALPTGPAVPRAVETGCVIRVAPDGKAASPAEACDVVAVAADPTARVGGLRASIGDARVVHWVTGAADEDGLPGLSVAVSRDTMEVSAATAVVVDAFPDRVFVRHAAGGAVADHADAAARVRAMAASQPGLPVVVRLGDDLTVQQAVDLLSVVPEKAHWRVDEGPAKVVPGSLVGLTGRQGPVAAPQARQPGATTVHGSLTDDQVHAGLAALEAGFAACGDGVALDEDGAVHLKIVVRRSGEVHSSRAMTVEGAPGSYGACLAEVGATAQFPALPSGGVAVVEHAVAWGDAPKASTER